MVLLVDNYDSFTYNLADYIAQLGIKLLVKRNDTISMSQIKQLQPSSIVISPGPHSPKKAGISLNIIEEFKNKMPILGICLGHQVIAQAFGAKIGKAKSPVHGKICKIKHNNQGVFKNLYNPIKVTRYHSLIVEKDNLPECLEITAITNNEQQEIMGIKHKKYKIEGIQFHPEAILTQQGLEMLKNFFNNLLTS